MKNFLAKAITIIAASVASTASIAMPHVYQCKIFDYLETGVETTEFQFVIGSEATTFTSANSSIRMNYNKSHATISLSLRPLNDHRYYARREDNGTPMQLSLTHSIPGYAATVRCSI